VHKQTSHVEEIYQYNFSLSRVGRGIGDSDSVIKVDENATIALCTFRINKDIPHTDIAVQNTRHLVELPMGFRYD